MRWYNEMHFLLSLVFFLLSQFSSSSVCIIYICLSHFYLSISFSLSRSHCYSDYSLDLGINILRCLCTHTHTRQQITEQHKWNRMDFRINSNVLVIYLSLDEIFHCLTSSFDSFFPFFLIVFFSLLSIPKK